MTLLLKTALYLGAVLLLGASIFRLWVGPELAAPLQRRLKLGVAGGALLLLSASIGDVIWSVTRLLGHVDPALIWEYARYTNHGRATLVRLALVGLLLPLSLKRGWLRSPLLIGAGLGLLVTFSVLSHATTMHGLAALLADLAHFTAATLWGSAVLYTALSPAWGREPADGALVITVERVSSFGLWCVIALVATGIYASLLHLSSPAELTGTPYGLALILKLALVGIILLSAAINRWWLLPALRGQGKTRRLGQMLRLEAFLLLTVLAATGLLTTRPLPHD